MVQLDVKKDIRPRGPSFCFQGNEVTKFEPILDSLYQCTLEWKLHESALGTVLSNKVQMSRSLPEGAPESPVIFTVIMKLVLRDFIKSWNIRPRRLCAACNLLFGRCGAGCCASCCWSSDG